MRIAERVGWRLARWQSEASCISQICRVIKLIKRLTHAAAGSFSLLSLPLLSFCISIFSIFLSSLSGYSFVRGCRATDHAKRGEQEDARERTYPRRRTSATKRVDEWKEKRAMK